MKNARQTAFEILNRIQKDNSYSNLVLDSFLEKSELSQVDKGLASAIVYGVVERLITLDFELSDYLKQPLKKLKPQVLTVLRMGAYQILFMDKIPDSAAINESVKLTKSNGMAFASGLVNAVLRKVSVNGLSDTDDISVRYSAPVWLYNLWKDDYGKENAIKLLESTFGSVDAVIRVNTLKTSADKLIALLKDEGFDAEVLTDIENALVVRGNGAVHKTKAYNEGLFHVQDVASQLSAKALDASENDIVLDVCAAPGGKSFTVAQYMKNKGQLYSMDIYPQRLELIKNGCERLGITNVSTVVNDAASHNEKIPKADRILCDVPCAGLGVIRKKPEIRYKQYNEVKGISELQYTILCESSKYLKKDGILIYSTCSLNKDENENVIKKFLSEHDEFESFAVLKDLKRVGEFTDYITLMPHIHNCDGFFIAGIRKIKDV